MTICTICRFETELDDVVVACHDGHSICLRCFARETETARPLPKALQREVMAVLATLEPVER